LFYCSNSKSLVYGKTPQRITIYEKHKLLNNSGNEIITRVESQCRRDKIPIQRLCEIEKTRSYNPFEKISFVDVSYDYFEVKNVREAKNFAYLKNLIELHGINEARKIVNKDGHFERDFRKFLQPVKKPDLLAIFQESLDRLLSYIK
nr:hypothetical protein [bacterium]